MMDINFNKISEYIPYLLNGVWTTLGLALIASLGGILLAFIYALIMRRQTVFSKIIKQIIDVFRGTPVAFQLTFLHLALPQLFPILTFSPWVSASIVFILNSAAYMAEIIRAGIDQISKGQIEAAHCLGLSQSDITKDIIIPQAISNILPAMINEFITLIKETSIVSFIGLTDLMRRSTIVQGTTFRYFESLIIVGVTYYLLTKTISLAGSNLERKFKYD
jgi:polar amino acid transport system permease protein